VPTQLPDYQQVPNQDQNYTPQLPAVVAADRHIESYQQLPPAAVQLNNSSRSQGQNPTMAEQSLAALRGLVDPAAAAAAAGIPMAAPGDPCMMLPDQDQDAGPKGLAGNKMLSSKYR
jgi:hypothetical protein